jgi:predicted lysophospholipase L1 biosynthesis ABC-type transport system permease subunit
MALGIGAACAILSVVNAVLPQPLPFPEPERVKVVWERNLTEDQPKSFTSYGVLADLEEQSQVFAGTALLLAAVGVFGIKSFVVSKRTSETGFRMALGARRYDIFRLMIGCGMLLVTVGTVAGLGVALATSRVLAAQLFAVSATDPLTLAAVSLVTIGVALLACYLPARRAPVSIRQMHYDASRGSRR